MGKYLDTAFSSLITFYVLFFLLSFTGKDVRLICLISALSAFCMAVIVNAILKRTKKIDLKRKRKLSDKKVKSLIYLDERDALNSIYQLLSKKYRLHDEIFDSGALLFREGSRETRWALIVIRKFKASPDDILSVWREIRKKSFADKILFVIPGKSDADVKLMPIKLMSPDVQILDKAGLKKLVRKYDLDIPESFNKKTQGFSLRIKSVINRKRALRYIGCALLLLINYIFFGQILYLIFAFVLSFASVFSLLSQTQYEFLSD